MAITRSMKKGHDPPAPKNNQSSVVKHVPKKPSKPKALPRRRVAQEKNVDRLTSLPLELFKMIMEGLVRDISRMVYYHSFRRRKLYDELTARINQLMKLRFVSRLFCVEITSAIFKAGRPVDENTEFFWNHLGTIQPLMISRLLVEESLSRTNSNIGILALIQQTVGKLLDLQANGSTISRRALVEATCSCIFHATRCTEILYNLTHQKSTTFVPYRRTTFEQEVENSCWAVASWMGNIPLLDILEAEYGPITDRKGDKVLPSFTGSTQWAAARNGNTDVVKYLQQKGCDFGQRQADYFDLRSPLCGAVDGNHAQIFKEILPSYDRYRVTASELSFPHRYNPDRWPRTLLSRKIATDGSEEMVQMFWARKPFMDEEELSQALIHMCLSGRHDKAKKAAILIKSGASVEKYCEYNGTTPLEAAITTGPPELLRFLLQNGGSPTATIVERYNSCKKYRSDPLIKALDSGKIDSMKELLQHCKWEVATKANMLLEAVNKDSLDMVKVLASPDHFDPTSSRRAVNMGRAAVRQARANFKTEIVDVLLAHGCQ